MSRRSSALVLGMTLALWARPGLAGRHDLQLLNLCQHELASGTLNGMVPDCTWVNRAPGGSITSFALDGEAETRYRSLMSELGVVVAPRLQTPADSLGFSGFHFSADVAVTKVSSGKAFWDGTEGLSPTSASPQRAAGWIGTVGVHARKGIWLPLPAFEIGGGAVHVLDSRMFALQAYAKFALHEGFHGWAIPSLAVRGGVSRLVGTDQVALTVASVDASVSKQFSLAKTARLEPFGGWSLLVIDARSEVLDATPSCDAYALAQASGGKFDNPYCANAQAGTWNDLEANFIFPNQDVITRTRVFGGFKLKFSVLAMVAQYEYVPAGKSRDEKKAGGAVDRSGAQQSVSLSGGFDF